VRSLTPSWRRRLRFAAGLIAAAAIVAAIAKLIPGWRDVDLARLAGAQFMVALLLMALAFSAAMLFRAARWHGQVGKSLGVGLGTHFLVLGWSFLLLNIWPFRIGDLIRVAWVRKWGGSLSLAAGAMVEERLADIFVLIILAGIAFMAVDGVPEWLDLAVIPYFILCLLAYLCFPFICAPLARKIEAWRGTHSGDGFPGAWLGSAAGVVAKLAHGASAHRSLPARSRLMMLTIGYWVMVCIAFYVVIVAIAPDVSFMATVAVVALVHFSSIISVVPSNIGVFEGSAVLALVAFGIPAELALLVAIGVHIGAISSALLIGVPARLWIAIPTNERGAQRGQGQTR
jgi:uncharacterized protein (TIRG00374 family)